MPWGWSRPPPVYPVETTVPARRHAADAVAVVVGGPHVARPIDRQAGGTVAAGHIQNLLAVGRDPGDARAALVRDPGVMGGVDCDGDRKGKRARSIARRAGDRLADWGQDRQVGVAEVHHPGAAVRIRRHGNGVVQAAGGVARRARERLSGVAQLGDAAGGGARVLPVGHPDVVRAVDRQTVGVAQAGAADPTRREHLARRRELRDHPEEAGDPDVAGGVDRDPGRPVHAPTGVREK